MKMSLTLLPTAAAAANTRPNDDDDDDDCHNLVIIFITVIRCPLRNTDQRPIEGKSSIINEMTTANIIWH